MRILLVEDQEAVRQMLGRLLQKWGHKVATAATGEDAWQKLRAVPIDMLVSDWNLPGASGLKLVEKIRETPQFEHIPILMISGRTDRTDIVEAMATGTHS